MKSRNFEDKNKMSPPNQGREKTVLGGRFNVLLKEFLLFMCYRLDVELLTPTARHRGLRKFILSLPSDVEIEIINKRFLLHTKKHNNFEFANIFIAYIRIEQLVRFRLWGVVVCW